MQSTNRFEVIFQARIQGGEHPARPVIFGKKIF